MLVHYLFWVLSLPKWLVPHSPRLAHGFLQRTLQEIRYLKSDALVSSTNYLYTQQTADHNLTTTAAHSASSAFNYDFYLVIAFVCCIVLVALVIALVFYYCISRLNSSDSSPSENSKSAKARRKAKKQFKKKKVKQCSLVVAGKQLSPSGGQGSKAVVANQHSKPSTVSRPLGLQPSTAKSKGTLAVGGGKSAAVLAASSSAGPVAALPSKRTAVKARPSSKQGVPRKVKKSSSVYAPPPVDTRFGTLDPKLLIDIDIDQPSKSALDSTASSVSVYSQNMSVSALLKKSSTRAKASAAPSKHQLQHKRQRKPKKTG